MTNTTDATQKCPHCTTPVSVEAQTCPHCHQKIVSNSLGGLLILIFVAIGVLAAVFGDYAGWIVWGGGALAILLLALYKVAT